ncbi:MAG: phosphotransferase family protein [bacterium]|nr:phosphotransferase family protein [bacterium]MCY4192980.1 phosphotransferase family protein [bacterium]MCY4273692.1 phosphotransferase family protein [bacterium]
MTDGFQAALETFVRRRLGEVDGLRVECGARVTGGQSRENWPFDLYWQDEGRSHHRPLFLRRDPAGSVLETDRRVEYEVLRRLGDQPVRSPEAVWLDADGSELGRPALVMARYEGRNDHFILEGGTSGLDEDARVGIASQMVDLMAEVHALDWKAAGLQEALAAPGDAAAAAIDQWAAVIERQSLDPQPVLAYVERWLRRHKPSAGEIVVVHGDIKPGNVLFEGQQVQILLDWETAHLGDPIEDVGWVTNPIRRREHQIPGRWEEEELVSAYEARTGRTVDRDALRFWQVLANYKLAAIALTGVRSFCDGRTRRVWMGAGLLGRVLLAQIGEQER